MILAESLSTSAEIVAWICFGLGVLLVIGGVVLGLALSYPKTVVDIRRKVEHAKARVDELLATAVATAGESAPNPGGKRWHASGCRQEHDGGDNRNPQRAS